MVNLVTVVELLEHIRIALNKPLPGEKAHSEMLPTRADKSSFPVKPKSSARVGAVLLALYEDQGRIKIPLIKRPKYDGVHAGQISFPGGKLEPEDSDLIETALRETHEEIGIEPEKIEVIGTMSELYIVASNFNVLPVVGVIKKDFDYVPDGHEVESIVEADLEEIINDDNLKEKVINVRNLSIHAPYFDIQGHVVWGATAMMLSEFRWVIKQHPESRWMV